MKIAITGATGFLGQHLTQRALVDGHSVRMLVRDRDKATELQSQSEVVVGDITDPAVLADLVGGCDAVIHLVSNFRVASGPPESYDRINVQGTRCVLETARTAGVGRFVHCSTIGVHGHIASTPADETTAFGPGDLYQSTKLEAETLAREAIGSSPMEVVILRPCSIYGPGDLRMLKMFRMLERGRFFTLGPCRENFHAVYIDDLVAGFFIALEKDGIDGETFILGGPSYLSLWDYLCTAAEAVGSRPPWIRLPYGPFYGLSVLCEKVCLPFGIEPPLHPRRVRFFKNNRAFSIEKARTRLGYDPSIELAEGMRRTVAWYRSEGLLR